MPGGVGDYCTRLIQALGERNNKALDLAVLTIRDGALSLLDAPGTEYSRVSHARNMHSWGWPVLGAVSEVVGSWKPDILHIRRVPMLCIQPLTYCLHSYDALAHVQHSS